MKCMLEIYALRRHILSMDKIITCAVEKDSIIKALQTAKKCVWNCHFTDYMYIHMYVHEHICKIAGRISAVIPVINLSFCFISGEKKIGVSKIIHSEWMLFKWINSFYKSRVWRPYCRKFKFSSNFHKFTLLWQNWISVDGLSLCSK